MTVTPPRPAGLSAALLALALGGPLGAAGAPAPELGADPHYSEAGFFDMHLCNWPDRPQFFKVLFSTPRFADIQAIDVQRPDGEPLVSLDLGRFMILEAEKDRPEKRVFMLDIDVPPGAGTGWYRARVRTRDGAEHELQDYVVMSRLGRVAEPTPANEAEDVPMPAELAWKPVPGAQYYQVFVRDAWTNELLLRSKLLSEPRVEIPAGTLQPGGYYQWTVHARDTNAHILLGDFHMGSMSDKFWFWVAE